MASTLAYDPLYNYLTGKFAPIPVIHYDTIDVALEQSKDTIICLEEEFTNEDLAAFGDPNNLCMRETGYIYIHVFVPSPESSGVARIMAQTIKDDLLFKNFLPMRITNITPPEADFMNNGLWTGYGVLVQYTVDRYIPRP